MRKSFLKIIIAVFLLQFSVVSGQSGESFSLTFIQSKNDNLVQIKPSKLFETIGNEMILYQWKYKREKDSKTGEEVDQVEPIYLNGSQLRLNPSEKPFLINFTIPDEYNYTSSINEPFHLLIEDRYNELKGKDNNKYVKSVLFTYDDGEQLVFNHIIRQCPLLSDDVMILTESMKIYRWNKKDSKFIFSKADTINPDLLSKTDKIEFERLFLFRYCKRPWANKTNMENKTLGYLNSFVGYGTSIVVGRKIALTKNPVITNNKIMYPLSSLARDLGFSYSFNGDTLNIKRTKENTKEVFSYEINTTDWTIQRDNKTLPLLPKPYKAGNETMIPLRTICELLDARVFWRDIDRSVLIERF